MILALILNFLMMLPVGYLLTNTPIVIVFLYLFFWFVVSFLAPGAIHGTLAKNYADRFVAGSHAEIGSLNCALTFFLFVIWFM